MLEKKKPANNNHIDDRLHSLLFYNICFNFISLHIFVLSQPLFGSLVTHCLLDVMFPLYPRFIDLATCRVRCLQQTELKSFVFSLSKLCNFKSDFCLLFCFFFFFLVSVATIGYAFVCVFVHFIVYWFLICVVGFVALCSKCIAVEIVEENNRILYFDSYSNSEKYLMLI